ncbi:hypothetical protein FA10DRAFT_268471, partial [Acaromyces ingoldii]
MATSAPLKTTQALHQDALSREAAVRGFPRLAMRQSQRFREAVVEASLSSLSSDDAGAVPSRRRPLWGETEENVATSSSTRIEDLLPTYYVQHNARCGTCATPLYPGLTSRNSTEQRQHSGMSSSARLCTSCLTTTNPGRPIVEAKSRFAPTRRVKRRDPEHAEAPRPRYQGLPPTEKAAERADSDTAAVKMSTAARDGKDQDLGALTLEQRAALLRRKKKAESSKHKIEGENRSPLPTALPPHNTIDESSKVTSFEKQELESRSEKKKDAPKPMTLDAKANKRAKKGQTTNDKSAALRALLQKDKDKDKSGRTGGSGGGGGGLMDFLGSL